MVAALGNQSEGTRRKKRERYIPRDNGKGEDKGDHRWLITVVCSGRRTTTGGWPAAVLLSAREESAREGERIRELERERERCVRVLHLEHKDHQ